ncbi:MAG TPA: hypothetical protein VGK17_12480 [Propionicimonas sp.]
MPRAADGWREPRLRLLRTLAVIVILALLVWLVAFEPGPTDTGAVGTLAGALLVILGFEALIRLPGKP